MTTLEKISHETMVFMRGRYCLDEIGNGKNELKFKQGNRTILTVYTYEDRFTFLIIFGSKECENFEAQRSEFSEYICTCYDDAKSLSNGKRMYIDVTEPEQLKDIKKLIQIKKKPNRKPFPKENAVFAKCGQRCDLCIHYFGMDEKQRADIEPYLNRMWSSGWDMRCGGCDSDACYCKDDPCTPKSCAVSKGLAECTKCAEYPCISATTADHRSMIHSEVHYADEITWAILPYVPLQYEKMNSEEEKS